MINRDDLRQLIHDLAEAKREYDRLLFDEEADHSPGAPASSLQIAEIERILGKPLPPSYRVFLELHNGWSDFAGGAKLLAVEDHGSDWVKKRLKELGDLLFEDYDKNPFLNGAIPVLLGKDENSYLVLDPGKVQKNGEMDFVLYDYGTEERRFESFTAFLQNDLLLMQRLIENEKHGISDEDDEDEEDEE
jgi:hypothetical protein